ncbi:hypothetical protein RB201_28155 [Streptomyces sp. S1A(2023)]
MINLSEAAAPLPPNSTVLVTSQSLSDGLLPPDTGVWLRTA